MQVAQLSLLHSNSAGAAPSSRTHLHTHSESHTQAIHTTTITTADIQDPHMASYEMSCSTTPSAGKTEHLVSAEALTERLLKFKAEHSADTYLPLPQQQSNHHHHYPSDPSSISSSPSSSSYTASYPSSFLAYPEVAAMGSRRSPQDTLQEILERIERRQHERLQDHDHDLDLEMELQTETLGRHRRLQLNPEMLKDHHHTLRQNHGNANLRHSWQES